MSVSLNYPSQGRFESFLPKLQVSAQITCRMVFICGIEFNSSSAKELTLVADVTLLCFVF